MLSYIDEAIVLRTWPFQEADLLVSLFTREHGRIKGVARHALRSRRRFGGSLEPMTHVRASWAEKPRQPIDALGRLDSFEILSSPLSGPIDYARTAALQLLAEVLEETLPDRAPDDQLFRLTLATLAGLTSATGSAATTLPIAYFSLWTIRLMGWLPDLTRCAACGTPLRRPAGTPEAPTWLPETIWYSETADGVSCTDDRRPNSHSLSPDAILLALNVLRAPLKDLADTLPPALPETTGLLRFAITLLERNLNRRLHTARALPL